MLITGCARHLLRVDLRGLWRTGEEDRHTETPSLPLCPRQDRRVSLSFTRGERRRQQLRMSEVLRFLSLSAEGVGTFPG